MTTSSAEIPIALTPAHVPSARPRLRLWWFAPPLLLVAGFGAWYGVGRLQARAAPASGETEGKANSVRVEVVAPRPGGIDRICIQPGTLEPFESADLYAKVSGFLGEQHVKLGSRVKAGQILAKIAVPEADKQVERDAARLQHAEAIVKQMGARIVAAEAEAKSAEVSVGVAKTQVKAKGAYRRFQEKRLIRFKELNVQKVLDARVVDEAEDQYEASVEAESASIESVTAAEQRFVAAKAKIDQSRADLDEANAEVKVAVAELERSRVLVAYSVIVSPYDGVITKQSFDRGAFIRSADVGGDRIPLLVVERIDKMTVVVQVPDRDVPYANAGDPATVEIDALPGRSLKSAIARVAESEDPASRTMRTEIDIPNPDGRLARGMYGQVTMLLEAGHPSAFTVPSATLTGRATGNKATVRVVRDGTARTQQVVTGMDNGVEVEILSGLTRGDVVVLRANGPLEEGSAVSVSEPGSKKAGH